MTQQETEQAQRLHAGLKREREIYQSLGEISRQQDEILRTGKADEILRLAQLKEAELNRIDEIERELAPLKTEWRSLRDRIEASLRTDVEGELDQIQVVLRALIDQEAKGQQDVQRSQQETAEKLRQVEGGRRLHTAYKASPPSPRSRYVDRVE